QAQSACLQLAHRRGCDGVSSWEGEIAASLKSEVLRKALNNLAQNRKTGFDAELLERNDAREGFEQRRESRRPHPSQRLHDRGQCAVDLCDAFEVCRIGIGPKYACNGRPDPRVRGERMPT